MRKAMRLGIGAGTAAMVAAISAGVAMASPSSPQHQTAAVAAATTVNKHITRAQAAAIASAKVPHSQVIEIESDDFHDLAVWKVQLATQHGRVTVDVVKRSGRAFIVQNGKGKAGDHAMAGGRGPAATEPGDDRGVDVRDNDHADDRGRDARDHDARGDRHDRDRGDDHGHDRGDDGSGR
jgi:hypothetical protein